MLNTREFIAEIKMRPALWDTSLKEYNNRDYKKKLWKEVANLFGGADLTNEKDKKELRQNLQKKWKNIRDSFARELRRMKKSETGLVSYRKSPYVYYEHMLFLKTQLHSMKRFSKDAHSTTQPENLTFNLSHLELSNGEGPTMNTNTFSQPRAESSPSSASKLNLTKKKRKTENTNSSKELINALCKSIQTREELERLSETDEDRMFLLSLLPELKKISEDIKFPTKMEIMNVIQKAKTGNSLSTEAPTYCQLTPVHPTYLGVSSYDHLTEQQFHTVAEIKPTTTTISVQNEENLNTLATPKEEILELF